MKSSFRIFLYFYIFIFLMLAAPAFAQTTLPDASDITAQQIAAVPRQAGLALPTTDPRIIAARIIEVALGFLGIVAVCLIIYAGFLWMTSAGEEEQIGKAKKFMINAVIGLAIILAAFGITQFIIRSLLSASGIPPLPPPSAAAGRVGGGALGSGIIESHYPKRGERNVARNTRVLITFKQAVNPASLANSTVLDEQGKQRFFNAYDYNNDGTVDARVALPNLTLLTGAIQIIKTADISGSVRESAENLYLGSSAGSTDVLVSFTNDLRTFIFTPVARADHNQRALFGSAEEDISYTIYLCGTISRGRGNCQLGGIQLLNGVPAFQGNFKDYQWSFEAGTFLDVTPPTIQSVLPLPDNTADSTQCGTPPCRYDQPRNAMMQVNFDEPILPTVASGSTAITADGGIQAGTYNIMRVVSVEDSPSAEGLSSRRFVAGKWEIGNQYQTSEFISTDLCAQNSCGGDVFCLPGGAEIRGEVLAATLPAAGGLTPLNGIQDVAGNSLDGNKNKIAEGPVAFFNRNVGSVTAPGDNVRWSFYTSHELLLDAPEITNTSPAVTNAGKTAGVALDSTISTTFNRYMAATTLNSRNINLAGTEQLTGGMWDTWWTMQSSNLDESLIFPYGQTRADILNGGLWEQTDYTSAVCGPFRQGNEDEKCTGDGAGVKDLFQNCYFPSGQCGTGLTPETPYCCDNQACVGGDAICARCGF